MSNDNASKLNALQQRAGDRYAPLVFYQAVLKVLAWIHLGLGVFVFLLCSVLAAGSANSEGGIYILLGGFGGLMAGAWAFFMLKVMANLLLAITDVAVNSHLQVYLLSEKE